MLKEKKKKLAKMGAIDTKPEQETIKLDRLNVTEKVQEEKKATRKEANRLTWDESESEGRPKEVEVISYSRYYIGGPLLRFESEKQRILRKIM